MPPQLVLDNVTVRRGRSLLLDAVSAKCEPSTITALRGRNGSGKSTLLGVALGLVRPSGGHVTRRGNSSFLQENFSPPGGMSADTYLRWVSQMRRVPRSRSRSEIQTLLATLELPSSTLPMRLLSKGNLQRVGVASALLGNPALVVLDEPFSGMDPRGAALIADAIHRGRAAGSTFLVVHHGDGDRLNADQTLQLTEGRLSTHLSTALRITAVGGTDLPSSVASLGTVSRVANERVVLVVEENRVGTALRMLLSAEWRIENIADGTEP